jgi:hypothetical protein
MATRTIRAGIVNDIDAPHFRAYGFNDTYDVRSDPIAWDDYRDSLFFREKLCF